MTTKKPDDVMAEQSQALRSEVNAQPQRRDLDDIIRLRRERSEATETLRARVAQLEEALRLANNLLRRDVAEYSSEFAPISAALDPSTATQWLAEVRRKATEDEAETWFAMLKYGPRSEINTDRAEEALAEHDAEVERRAREDERVSIEAEAAEHWANNQLGQIHDAGIAAQVRREALEEAAKVADAEADEAQIAADESGDRGDTQCRLQFEGGAACAGSLAMKLRALAAPSEPTKTGAWQQGLEATLAEMCEHVGEVIEPDLVTVIRNEVEKERPAPWRGTTTEDDGDGPHVMQVGVVPAEVPEPDEIPCPHGRRSWQICPHCLVLMR